MSITGARKSFDCEKLLKFVKRFWKSKKKSHMVFELMVSLCIKATPFFISSVAKGKWFQPQSC